MADKLSLTLLHLLQTQLLILLIRRLCWFCLFLTWSPADMPLKKKGNVSINMSKWGLSFTPLNNPLFALMDVFKLAYAN